MLAEVRRAAFLVKARNRKRGLGHLPVLWLFTDSVRLANPGAVLATLPPGLCGLVLRPPMTTAHAIHLARAARARRVVTVSAGIRLPGYLRTGTHLRVAQGEWRCRTGFATASTHSAAELRRARQAGVTLAFLSPLFPTASHPGGAALGPRKWTALARGAGGAVAALGGITSARSLPRSAAGIGAIAAFGPGAASQISPLSGDGAKDSAT